MALPSIVPNYVLRLPYCWTAAAPLDLFSNRLQTGGRTGRVALQLQGELAVIAGPEILVGANDALHQMVANHVDLGEHLEANALDSLQDVHGLD